MCRILRRARHAFLGGAAGLFVCAACLGILVPQALTPRAWAQDEPPARAGNDDDALPTAEDVREITLRAGALKRLAQAQLDAVPRFTFDPEALAQLLGDDVDAHFATIRDATDWVPYGGALRSPSTVLMAESGNALDRARLLAATLGHAGREARLARATLADTDAAALADRYRQRTVAAQAEDSFDEEPVAPDDDAIAAVAATAGVSPDTVRQAVNRQELQSQEILEQLVTRGIGEAERLTQLIEAQRPQGAGEVADARLINPTKLARDHWWVQVRDGDTWIDLDVAHPDGQTGAAFAAPEQTFDPAELAESLPEDQRHRVVVRVLGEQTKGDGRAEHVLLEHTIEAWQHTALDVDVAVVPLDFPEGFDVFDEERTPQETAAEMKRLLLEQAEWLPSLRVDGRNVTAKSIRDTGEVVDTPARGVSGRKINAAVNALGGLGGLGGGDQAGPYLSAMWIEIETRSPGGLPDTQRRVLFELGDEADTTGPPLTETQRLDRAYGLLGQTTLMVQTGRWNQAYTDDRQFEALLTAAEIAPAMTADGMNGDAQAMVEKIGQADLPPSALLTLGLARFGVNPRGGEVFVDRPNVLSQFAVIGRDPTGVVKVWRGIDILHNRVAPRPTDAASVSAETATGAVLYQGVFDTVVEAVIVEGLATPSGLAAPSAAAMLGRVATDDLTVLANPDDLEGVPVNPEAEPAIRAALAAGAWVVLARYDDTDAKASPDRLPGQAWWRIDPATGQTLGMMTSDLLGTRGVSMTEAAILITMALVGLAVGFFTFAGCGGFADGASTTKILSCTLCAAIASALAMITVYAALSAVAAGAAAEAAVGAMSAEALKAAAAAMAEIIVSQICNAVSGFMSRAPDVSPTDRRLAANFHLADPRLAASAPTATGHAAHV